MKSLLSVMLVSTVMLSLLSCSQKQQQNQKDPVYLLSQIDQAAAPNTLSENESEKGWVLLFDGKSTAGWHGYNMAGFPDCWTIEDGCFTMTTTGGAESQDIITDKIYKSFAISVEYKLTPAANSGLIWQIKEDTLYKFPYETGPEMQVIDHEGWPEKLEEWQINGANYAMYNPIVKPYKPVGEWNQMMVVVDSNKVTQFLNGQKIVEYVKYSEEWNKLRNSGKWNAFPDWGKYDEGHISLQNHGTKVWYRSIKLKELI